MELTCASYLCPPFKREVVCSAYHSPEEDLFGRNVGFLNKYLHRGYECAAFSSIISYLYQGHQHLSNTGVRPSPLFLHVQKTNN